MQYRTPIRARVCVVAGMTLGVLMASVPSAFAGEATSFTQNRLLTTFSAASSSYSPTSPYTTQADPQDTEVARTDIGRNLTIEIVNDALNMIGVRYRWGGNTPNSGLDCSGFVRYVFQETLGLALPRRAEEMSHVGEKVRFEDLKPGDLVFFNTTRRTVSHVGIYIGKRKFVHSPSTGSTIRVDDLKDYYWQKHLMSARRIDVTMLDTQNVSVATIGADVN